MALLGLLLAFAGSLPLRATSLLVPAYFSPSGSSSNYWNSLNQAAAKVPVVAIMNPNNGPGSSSNKNYQRVVDALRGAGGKVIGYVYSSYAARALSDVEADISSYKSWYNVDGIFVDEMTSDSTGSHLTYYNQLCQYIKATNPGWMVVGNPGGKTVSAYLTTPAVDVLVTYENGTGYSTYTPPSWTYSYSASNFVNLCYSNLASASMSNCVDLCRSRNTGWIFITDDILPNPWDTLPAYWTNEVAYVQQLNRASLTMIPTAPGTFQLTVNGIPGRYIVDGSADLSAWIPLTTNVTTTGLFAVPLVGVTNRAAQFYRVRQFLQ